jgi:hypothetical protein
MLRSVTSLCTSVVTIVVRVARKTSANRWANRAPPSPSRFTLAGCSRIFAPSVTMPSTPFSPDARLGRSSGSVSKTKCPASIHPEWSTFSKTARSSPTSGS